MLLLLLLLLHLPVQHASPIFKILANTSHIQRFDSQSVPSPLKSVCWLAGAKLRLQAQMQWASCTRALRCPLQLLRLMRSDALFRLSSPKGLQAATFPLRRIQAIDNVGDIQLHSTSERRVYASSRRQSNALQAQLRVSQSRSGRNGAGERVARPLCTPRSTSGSSPRERIPCTGTDTRTGAPPPHAKRRRAPVRGVLSARRGGDAARVGAQLPCLVRRLVAQDLGAVEADATQNLDRGLDEADVVHRLDEL
mmetsp:Transcript_10689/g.20691  ORF Transcript_10689/g.20691 Transcript_10689/m.20691 type:complete len:252 (+) Transcript_10689:48-803(+)